MILFYAWTILSGFIIGNIAKLIHPGPDPEGFWATTAIGIFGSMVGSVIASTVNYESNAISSICGSVVVCVLWRFYQNYNGR